jgi:hypothetical protein
LESDTAGVPIGHGGAGRGPTLPVHIARAVWCSPVQSPAPRMGLAGRQRAANFGGRDRKIESVQPLHADPGTPSPPMAIPKFSCSGQGVNSYRELLRPRLGFRRTPGPRSRSGRHPPRVTTIMTPPLTRVHGRLILVVNMSAATSTAVTAQEASPMRVRHRRTLRATLDSARVRPLCALQMALVIPAIIGTGSPLLAQTNVPPYVITTLAG